MYNETEYLKKFNIKKNNNIILNNPLIDCMMELFIITQDFHSMCLIPLAECVMEDTYTPGNINKLITFFKNIDKSFEDYLGVDRCYNEEDVIKRIQELLDEEQDGRLKYYVVENNERFIGLFYIYEYNKNYNRCNIAIGLSSEYRGQGLAERIISSVCKELFAQGMLRIGLEVETTNKSSLKCCEKLADSLGFKREGVFRNMYGKGIDCVIYSLLPVEQHVRRKTKNFQASRSITK